MHRRLFCSTLLLALLTTMGSVDAQPTLSRSGLLITTVDSGQMFIIKEDHSVPLAVVNTWFRVGARNEDPADEGISHFLEHLFFDGTTSRDKDDYSNTIFRYGMQDNASTSYDWTQYYMQGPSEHFEVMAALHAEMLMGPALLDSEFDREREVVKEELRRAQDNPSSWLFRQMITAAYPHTGYDHQVLGTMETLNGQSNQQMRDYAHRFYGPNNAITIAVGDFQADEVLAFLIDQFKEWEPTELPADPVLSRDPQIAPQYVTLDGAFESTNQMLLFKAPNFASDETYAMDLLMSILGGGASSRLTREIADERGLVTSISAANYSKLDASTLYVDWELINSDTATETTEAILAEISRMRREGPTAEELAIAKRQVAIARVFENEDLLGSARSIGSLTLALGLEGYEQYLDRTFGVTSQDVQWVAQQYLNAANATLGIIGPAGTAQPTPEWGLLDAPFTSLVAPMDLGRLGQNPLSMPALADADGSVTPIEETYVLPNGMTVYLKQSHTNPTVGIACNFKGGLMWETWDTAGIGTLMTASLNEGTTHRSKDDITRQVDELGGNLAFSADREFFTVNGQFLSSDVKPALDLISDILINPTFPPERVRVEREQQLTAIAASKDNMVGTTFEQLRYAMYGQESSYGRPTNGRASVVSQLGVSDLASLHQAVIHPQNAVLTIVGQFDATEMRAMLAETFGNWIAGPEAQVVSPNWLDQAAPTMPEGTQRIVNLRDKAQSVIAIGIPGPGYRDDTLPTLEVLDAILGGSSESRLFRTLRGKEGLAYSTYSFAWPGQGTGAFYAYIATRTEMYEPAVAGIRREFARLRDEGATQAELDAAIANVSGNQARAHQGHRALATFAASNLAKELPVDWEWQQLDAVKAVTLEEVNALAAGILNLDNHWLAVSGPIYQAATPLD